MEAYKYKDNRFNINITKKQLKELTDELENKIYFAGHYKLLCGSNSIEVELDEDMTDEAFDELEEKEDWLLFFNIKHIQSEEDSERTDRWKIKVNVDKDLNIKNIEKY